MYDYSDAYILIKETLTVPNTAAAGASVNNTNKNAIFKNCCAPFTDCITELNNTEVDEANRQSANIKFSKIQLCKTGQSEIEEAIAQNR